MHSRPVGAEGAMPRPPPPDFYRSVNPIATSGAVYAHNINIAPPPPHFHTFLRPCIVLVDDHK